ncbi:MAG: contractile injection system protein, VgrG/Pvc8 family [Alphaproteobacteria bacterium]
MTPDFAIFADGIAATATFADRLLSLVITDAAGKESDAAEIMLDDRDGSIALPREGAKLAISLGYRETGLEYMGLFVVEEVEGSGFPRQLAITAKAADHRETFKEQKTRGWDQKTLGQIVGQIAGEHGLSAAVAGSLSARQIAHIAQTEESDQHFLTRLAARFGAIAAPKDGRLVFAPRGAGLAASGAVMTPVVVSVTDLVGSSAYSFTLKPRNRFSKVVATWTDRAGAKRREVEAMTNSQGPIRTLRTPFADEAQAQAAADAEARKIAREEGSISLEIAGRPAVRAEAPLTVSGVRTGADGQWTIERVEHTYDPAGQGYITSIEAKKGNA